MQLTEKIIVYSKKNCGKCESAKEKLRLMGLEFDERCLESTLHPSEDWQDNFEVMIELMSKFHMAGEASVPLIMINGTAYTYPEAMRKLKGLKT